MSPDQRVTDSQLNSMDWTEQRMGIVTVAGEVISWIIELLDPFSGQVSFNRIMPVNSSLNASIRTSGEGMVLALTVSKTVHIRPITLLDLPNI